MYLLNTYGEYYFLKTNETEIVSEFFGQVWEPTVDILVKAFKEQKKELKALIETDSSIKYTVSDLGDITKAQTDFLEKGSSNKILPSVLNILRTYINLPHIKEEFAKKVEIQLAAFQVEDVPGSDQLTNDQQLAWLQKTIDKRIEDHQRLAGKVDTQTLQTEVTNLQNKDKDQDTKIEQNKKDIAAIPSGSGSGTGLDSGFIEQDKTNDKILLKKETIVSDGKKLKIGTLDIEAKLTDHQKEIDDRYKKSQTFSQQEVTNKLNSEYFSQADLLEFFGFTTPELKIKKKITIEPDSSGNYPTPTKPGDVIFKKWFEENRDSTSAAIGRVQGSPFIYKGHFTKKGSTINPSSQSWDGQTGTLTTTNKEIILSSNKNVLFDRTKTYKLILDSQPGQTWNYRVSILRAGSSSYTNVNFNNQIFRRPFNSVYLFYDNGSWYIYLYFLNSSWLSYALSNFDFKAIKLTTTGNTPANFDLYIYEEGVDTSPATNPSNYFTKGEINAFRQTVFERIGQATGQNHLAFKFWTAAAKSPDTPWTENGDKTGLIGIEKSGNKIFLETSNTNLFKNGKNYDIVINLFKNGGSNNEGTQINLFAGSLVNPGEQARPDVLANNQTFDSYQFTTRSDFGPSEANQSHLIREPAWAFNEFNEITMYLRLRKLSGNTLLVSTLQPIYKYSQRNDGSYLLTKSDFVAKISNDGNGKFWKFGIRTGNWDNVNRVEFFIRGENE